MTVSTITFGLASLSTTALQFLLISALARLFEGIADASMTVTMSSIICKEFSQMQEKYLGYLNMAIGFGTCLGAIVGSQLIKVVSYSQLFYIIAAVIGSAAIVQIIFLPSRLNDKEESHEEESIGYIEFLKRPKVVVLLMM